MLGTVVGAEDSDGTDMAPALLGLVEEGWRKGTRTEEGTSYFQIKTKPRVWQ